IDSAAPPWAWDTTIHRVVIWLRGRSRSGGMGSTPRILPAKCAGRRDQFPERGTLPKAERIGTRILSRRWCRRTVHFRISSCGPPLTDYASCRFLDAADHPGNNGAKSLSLLLAESPAMDTSVICPRGHRYIRVDSPHRTISPVSVCPLCAAQPETLPA